MFKKILPFSLFLILTVILLWRQVAAAPNSSIVVNSTADTQTNDGQCTLREAMINANADDQSGSTDCAAGSGADEITFSDWSQATILLGSQLPDVTSVMTITGPGPDASVLALDGGDTVRVFFVQSNGNLILDTLTITNGHASENGGGGIYNDGGSVYIWNNIVSSSNGGSVGGGLMTLGGSANIWNSTFSGNYAVLGGGVFMTGGGKLNIASTTFAGNSAGYGGGLYFYGTVNITNSTFSGNSASSNYGGGLLNGGTVFITDSTFSANSGGGVSNYSNGTLNLMNSLLANSTNGGDCYNESGSIIDNGGNLVEDGSCGLPIGGDPLLGLLADNGGPTLTHALLPGSPALNAANPANCPSTDQRGVFRPQGDLCDIGAFELEATTATNLTGHTPDPSIVGQPVNVTFLVTSTLGTPTGVVTVSASPGESCNGILSGGVGNCDIAFLTAGAHTLTAAYAGTASFASSVSDNVGHTVDKANATVSIIEDTPDPSDLGQPLNISFTVTSTVGIPTGIVTVTASTGESCVGTLVSSVSSCEITFLTAGSRNLTAAYSGDSNFNSGNSTSIAHAVNKGSTTTTLTGQAPDPSNIGEPVLVSFSVAGFGTPTGNVTIGDGVDFCTATVAQGSCVITLTTVGTRILTASYSGDANYIASVSPGISHTVENAKIFLPLALHPIPCFAGPNEQEPNDSGEQATGALCLGQDYFGTPGNDNWDYFYFTLTAPGTVKIDVTNHPLASVGGAQVQLYYGSVSAANQVGDDVTGPYQIIYEGLAGTYYVGIFNDTDKCDLVDCSEKYTLHVSLLPE